MFLSHVRRYNTLNIVTSLTILVAENCVLSWFYLIQYENGWLAASDLFHMFTQSYTFYYRVLRVQMFEKCDSSNRQ